MRRGSASGRRASRRVELLCLLLVLAGNAPLPAAAQTCAAEARSGAQGHKRLGLELRASDPEGAAREFEAANRLCPDPWYEGILAVCYERAGRINDAIKAIDAYLGHPRVGQREQAEAARGRLAARLSKLEVVTAPPGAMVRARGPRGATEAVAPATLTLDPGRYELDARLEGYEPAQRQVELAPGAQERLDLALRNASAPPTERRDRGSVRAKVPAWTGAAGLAIDVAVPLTTAALKTAVGFAVEACGGRDLGRVRVEAALTLHAFPASGGYILELAGGPRLGARLGRVPLWLELEALVGWSLVAVDNVDAVLAQGQSSGVAIVPGLVLAYRAIGGLELYVRLARVEIFDVAGAAAASALYRWGFDLGVRYRR